MNKLSWGSKETELFIKEKMGFMFKTGIIGTYIDALREQSQITSHIDTSVIHSELPVLPYIPLNAEEGIVPFWIQMVHTETG